MSLSDHIPSEQTSSNRAKITTILWLSGLTFVGTILALLLLQRLGLPSPIALGTFVLLAWGSIISLSWISRTMTISTFFFADRALGGAPAGFGGTTDLLSGAFLIIFLVVPLPEKMILTSALVIGLLFQASLFSALFQQAGASTLPGFFTNRTQSASTGYAALFVVCIILSILLVAEFRVARDAITALSRLLPGQATLLVLFLAVLPAVFGGWLGLFFVNVALSLWVVICLVTPAFLVGFMPNLLAAGLELDFAGQALEPLQLSSYHLLGDAGSSSWVTIFFTIFVLAMGVSTLPQVLSRLATSAHPVEAVESLGWLALTVFVLCSALPLSLGLVSSTPSSQELATLLESQPVLHMLPYFALLFAALNGLAVTLFALAGALARAFGRYRKLDPGERSLFFSRWLIIVFALFLITLPESLIPDSSPLLVSAIVLAAGSLFAPLFATVWIPSIQSTTVSSAMLAGVVVTSFALVFLSISSINLPAFAGILGAMTGWTIIGRDLGKARVAAFFERRAKKP